MEKQEIVILGAGVAGIAAAYYLFKQGISSIIYEQENYWGGLCHSFQLDGFVFDTFAHISFDASTKVWLEDQTKHYIHQPEALNYDRGRWLRHPVQNNLYGLPVEERIELIESYINRYHTDSPKDYGEWLCSTYGVVFAKKYPYRYTRKYWTVDPELLETNWIKGRMYEPNLREVLQGAMTDKTPGVHYSKEARYPKHGGFEAFLQPMKEFCHIQCNKKVTNINCSTKQITFGDGKIVAYEKIISTIPLPEIIKLIDDVPEEVIKASTSLDYTSGVMVSLGFNRANISPALWYYIYDEDILPARIYAPDRKSKYNVPKNCSAIQAELYFSKYKPLKKSMDLLLEEVIEQLLSIHLFRKDEIIVKDIQLKPYANIMFTPTIYSARSIIHYFLKKKGIYYAGRFGEWDYLWTGQSLLSGRSAAKQLQKDMEG